MLGAQRLLVSLARSPAEVKEAQRLRHRVFVEEMGAAVPQGRIERDRFDPFCRHLIVRDRDSGEVVGTYRVLTPERAATLGTFMAEREFDLVRFAPIRGQIAEVGRACIDAKYRSGATIMLLWSGLASYCLSRGYRFLFGCVSLGFDASIDAAALFRSIPEVHIAPWAYRVEPRSPLPKAAARADPLPRLPALLKGYLRAGAWVCGPPAWDREFGTVDLPVLLALERVEQRYARHFLREFALTPE
jgi:putative hemolysin